MVCSSEFFANIREGVDIFDIISDCVHLEKKGRVYFGLCPFHSEKTPSFCVYIDTNSFYCFGCGVGGDVISFVSLMEKLSYREAAENLAEKFGLDIPDKKFQNDSLERKEIYEINRISAKFYYSLLMENNGNLGFKYLQSRGLKKATMTHFGLGYSPKDGTFLIKHLKNNNFSEEVILKSNLGIRLKNGLLRDRFVNRVIFPILDVKGNVVAFGARSLDGKAPKYLNTSDTVVFKKCNNLFSLNFAKKSKDYFILTEGYMDVISLYQLGIESAVASLGTSLTLNQCKLISKYTDKIYICYDNDNAGKLATERALSLLEKENLSVKIVEFDKAKDPDEFVKIYKDKSKHKFEEILDNSLGIIDFRISNSAKKFDISKTEEKINFLKDIVNIISAISDPIERDIYSSKICSKYGISRDAFNLKVKKRTCRDGEKQFFKSKKQKNTSNSWNLRIEEFFISCIIRDNGLLKYVNDFTSDDFCGKLTYTILEKIRLLVSEGEKVDIGSISNGFRDCDIGEISRILNLDSARNVDVSDFLNCVEFFKRKKQVKDFRLSKNFDDDKILKFLDKLKSDKL